MTVDVGWSQQNQGMSDGLPLLATKCEECGCVRFLAIGGELKAEDKIQARWNAGFAQLSHGGWMCWPCVNGHTDRTLLPAAEAVRTGYQKIRVIQGWKTETVRGKP